MGSTPTIPNGAEPTVIDLTTIANVKSWLSATGEAPDVTSDDANVQACITAAAFYWLWRTGRTANLIFASDGSLDAASQSPLCQPTSYDEFYDGNGNQKLFLRNAPIISVQLLAIDGVTVSASGAVQQAGYVIDQSKKCLAMRGGGMVPANWPRCGVMGFSRGVQNIEVQYTAGYEGVPFDVELACRQMVAVNYKRRNWIDQKSQAMAQGAGTVIYRDWELPPEVERVIDIYSRSAIV